MCSGVEPCGYVHVRFGPRMRRRRCTARPRRRAATPPTTSAAGGRPRCRARAPSAH